MRTPFRIFHAIVFAAALLPVLAGCGPSGSSGSSTPANAPFDPCCALTVAEPAGGGFGSSNLEVSMRRGDPSLNQWMQLAGQPGRFQASFRGFGFGTQLQDMKAIDVPLVNGAHEVHILAVIFSLMNVSNSGFDLGEIVQDNTGKWGTGFTPMNALVPAGLTGGPLGSDLGRTASFRRISAAVVGGVLNACAVEDKGQIELNRRINGAWEGWIDAERATSGKTGIIPDGQFTDVGKFIDVGCASVLNPATGTEELHICGVTDDGKLWHAIETAPFVFTQFADVQQAISHVGDFTRVDCAGNQSQLQLVGITKDGRAWHTIRIPSGAWQPFENVVDQANSGGLFSSFSGSFAEVSIGYCNDGVPPSSNGSDVSQLNVVFTSPAPVAGGGGIFLTIRAANPIHWNGALTAQHWRPLMDISTMIENSSDVANIARLQSTFPGDSSWDSVSIGSRPFSP